MKVYVTQGHEKGVGLEVFFKSCLMMSESDLKLIQLIAFHDSATAVLKKMKVPFKISKDFIFLGYQKISALWLNKTEFSESYTSLLRGMELSEKGGVLFTLPTSKDQFPGFPGHTEFFRSYYNRPELVMFFSSPQLKVLLLSDHIAIKDISETLTDQVILKRLDGAIASLAQIKFPIHNILISGFNPHAGEKGLIGIEDKRIESVIKSLTHKYKFNISGPYPGDTMIMEKKNLNDLLVYVFHDQGLGVFKSLQGLIGSNITLGLPYPRFSPDHGTSFNLFGKNLADYRGCAFSLNEALSILVRVVHGKNSGIKSKSS
jgi:4-hydroxythreonine-4-phosphate dehydrogenase